MKTIGRPFITGYTSLKLDFSLVFFVVEEREQVKADLFFLVYYFAYVRANQKQRLGLGLRCHRPQVQQLEQH